MGLHALLIAAFAGTKNRDWSRAHVAGDWVRPRGWHAVVRLCAIADPDPNPNPHAFTDAQPDAYGDQFDGVIGRGADQSRQQFPGTAGQSVEQRLQPPAAD